MKITQPTEESSMTTASANELRAIRAKTDPVERLCVAMLFAHSRGDDLISPSNIKRILTDAQVSLTAGWRLIESAPKDGRMIACWREGWDEWRRCCWKTNYRIEATRAEERRGMASSYFGDPTESDDYEYATGEDAPTHWAPLPDFPVTSP